MEEDEKKKRGCLKSEAAFFHKKRKAKTFLIVAN
jgi:hypothetical protein